MSASYEHLLQQSPPALQQDASSIWGARCMVGRVVLISALMDPLAAQRAISSIATEWVINELFQSQEARGPRGQEEEASAPHFESLKRPGGHVARGLTKLCVQPFLPTAHMLKRQLQWWRKVMTKSLACLSTRLTYTLSWGLSGLWWGHIYWNRDHLPIRILSSAMIIMVIIIFTTTMISSVRQRVPEWELRNPEPVLWWWAGASLQQIQLISASSHWCEFWRVSTWNTTFEGMTASKHKIFSIMSWMSRILTALCS